jgi:xanthine dehydrogenase accessory factor
MFDISEGLVKALTEGRPIAVAVVTAVSGSAPRKPGAAMAVDDEGIVLGSISGGCVEGSVYELAAAVLEDHRTRFVEFGVDDDDAFAVGLSCGGRLEVLITEFGVRERASGQSETLLRELNAARDGRPAGIGIVIDGEAAGEILGGSDPLFGTASGPLDPDVSRRIAKRLRAQVESGSSSLVLIDCDGVAIRVLCLVAAAPPRMLLFGAVDFSSALSDAARLLGYHVTVCDPRPVFADRNRFPGADEVIREWPATFLARTDVDERTVICVLSHDEKTDIPLLIDALRMPVAFVGAMGSRRTHDRRIQRLTEAGVTPQQLSRLHSPIGLDVGASTPQETAISILAEVLAARTGSSGAPLRDTRGPIHALEALAGTQRHVEQPWT